MTYVYVLLGLALVGSIFYGLYQMTSRQRRLNAELTRLEQLAAEVSMNAEAVLEEVDRQVERLQQLATQVEVQVQEAASVPKKTAAAKKAATASAKGASKKPAAKKATAKKTAEKTTKKTDQKAESKPAPQPAENTAPQPRYQQAREQVWALSEQGKTVPEIAQLLLIPRGEVELLLNLPAAK